MVTVIMGVSSSGKTTIGKNLSNVMNFIFIDADDYHSENNLLKIFFNVIGLNLFFR